MIIAMYTHRVHVETSCHGICVLCFSGAGTMPGGRTDLLRDPVRMRNQLIEHLQCTPYGARVAIKHARGKEPPWS